MSNIVHKLNVIQCRKCKKVLDFFALIEKKIQQEAKLGRENYWQIFASSSILQIIVFFNVHCFRKKIRFYVREKTRNVNAVLILSSRFFFYIVCSKIIFSRNWIYCVVLNLIMCGVVRQRERKKSGKLLL